MCDSCIIQLNVAYNLKKNAIQSDLKLRQYMIEFGINVTSYTTCSINTVSVIRPPAMLMPANTTSESVTITTAKSTVVEQSATPQQPQQSQSQQQLQPQPQPQSQPQLHRPFPVMPIIIKEEPLEYDELSDITVGTNNEAFIEQVRNQQRRNGSRSTPGTSTNSSGNKSVTPLPPPLVVQLPNNTALLGSSSDSEYISAFLNNSTPPAKKSKKTTQPNSPKKQNSVESTTLVTVKTIPSYRPGPKSKKQSPVSTTSSQNSENQTPTRRLRRREIDSLNDDSKIQMINNENTKRKTRQQLANHIENQQHGSRSRNATKSDYTSFFSSRSSNVTPKPNRRMSIDYSTSRRGRSANLKTPTRSTPVANIRTRRTSIAHNRTSI